MTSHMTSSSRQYSSRLKNEETQLFCLRVMVGVIILYDHVHPDCIMHAILFVLCIICGNYDNFCFTFGTVEQCSIQLVSLRTIFESEEKGLHNDTKYSACVCVRYKN